MNADSVQRRIGLLFAASGTVFAIINGALVAEMVEDNSLLTVVTHPRLLRVLGTTAGFFVTGVVCTQFTQVLQIGILVSLGLTTHLVFRSHAFFGIGIMLMAVILAYKYGYLEAYLKTKLTVLALAAFAAAVLSSGSPSTPVLLGALNSVGFMVLFIAVIGIAFDEELRRLSRYNAELRRELKKSEQAVKIAQHTGGLVHNLRNDLGLIYASLQVARLTADETSHLDEIESKLERLSGRVDRIMYATKCSEIQEPQNIDLDHLLASVVEGFQVERDFRRRVKVNFQFNGNVYIRAVPSDLSQMFENLIRNAYEAIKAHEEVLTERGQLGRISVRTEMQEGVVLATISDNGIGMENTSISSFHVGRTTKEQGNGYGMVYVIDTIEQYDGSIEITSTPGVGTSVRLSFGRAVTIPCDAPQIVQEIR